MRHLIGHPPMKEIGVGTIVSTIIYKTNGSKLPETKGKIHE